MMPFIVFRRRPIAQLWQVCTSAALLASLGMPWTPGAAQQTLPQSAALVGARPIPTVYTGYTPDASRAQLIARRDSLARFDTTTAAGRSRRDEIADIRRRLTEGDFRPGDRFLVQDLLLARVNDRTTPLGDTVIVREGVTGPIFSLNTWADASLRGVLRAELPATVEAYERIYVRDPRLRVVPLTRLSITGGVPRPGYYVVDPDRQLTDAITLAGGPGVSNQKKGRISIVRGTKSLYDTKAVQNAIRDGRTLDDLALRSGDEVRVEEPKRSRLPSAQTIFFGISALTGLIVLIRSLYNTY